jgi:hypothetical protein
MAKISYDEMPNALTDAARAHGVHERELGYPDPDWPSWYARHMVRRLQSMSGPDDPDAGTERQGVSDAQSS